MNGTWKTGFYYGTIKDGMIGIAPFGPSVSAKTKAAIAAKKQALISGKFYEFRGPLYDQKGKLRVQRGKQLSVKDLYAMDWLVKGIQGSARGWATRRRRGNTLPPPSRCAGSRSRSRAWLPTTASTSRRRRVRCTRC